MVALRESGKERRFSQVVLLPIYNSLVRSTKVLGWRANETTSLGCYGGSVLWNLTLTSGA